MAKHLFKKGNQAAKGRTLPPDVLAVRRLTRPMLESLIHKYMHNTTAELKEMLKEPKVSQLPAIDAMLISVMARSMSGGDTHRIQFLLNHLHGPLTQKLEVNDVTNKEMAEEMKNNLIKAIKEGKE